MIKKLSRKFNKRLNSLVAILSLFFLIFLGTLCVLINEEKLINQRSQNYLRAMRLAEELKRSSDNLSRFALSYLSTGDSFFKERYVQEQQLRRGDMPYPQRYRGGHWETSYFIETLDTLVKETTNGSYHHRLVSSGISNEQYESLQKAELLLDSLSAFETALFFQLENGTLNSQEATKLLIDPFSEGSIIKFQIVKKIDQFFTQGTSSYNIDLTNLKRGNSNLILLLISLLLINIYIFIRIIITVIQAKLNKLKELQSEIAERKKVEQKLLKSQINHINAQRLANFGSWEYDFEKEEIIWSEQVLLILGLDITAELTLWPSNSDIARNNYSPKNTENLFYFMDFVHPDDRELLIQTIDKQREQFHTLHLNYRLKLKNGEIKHINATIEAIQNNGNTFLTGVIKDVTELKNAAIKIENSHRKQLNFNIQLLQKEKELQLINEELNEYKIYLENMVQKKTKELMYSNDLLNALFKELPLGVTLFNKDGQVVETNPITSKLLKMTNEEITTQKLEEWIGLDKNLNPLPPEEFPIAKTLSQRKPVKNQEIATRTADGSLLWFNCNATVISEEYGGGGILIYSDITDNKRIEQEIIHAKDQAEKANRSKSQFLSNMSHEIRTPLLAIIGFAELLDAKIKDKQLKHYVSTIQAAGKNLSSLINDILDLAKIEAGKISLSNELVDLHQFKKELKSLFILKASEKDLKLEIKLTSNTPRYILIDELRLRQILFNLISNAIKFTHKGHVTVVIDAKCIAEETISLQLTVEDTGKGISHDKLSEIFDDFCQENEEVSKNFGGTGLGLSITHRLVNLFNGKISVNSNVGIGSTFEVILPEIKTSSNTSILSSHSPSKVIDLSNYCILVVDDNNDNRNLMEEHLKELNAQILLAKNGLEATEQAITRKPHLILMDIKMPIMDGYQAAKLIFNNETTAHIPIIACTAFAFSQVEDHILQAGFKGYLRKPILKKDLIEELSKHLTDITHNDEIKIIPEKEIQEKFKHEIRPAWDSFKTTKIKNSKINLAKKVIEIAKTTDNKQLEKIGTNLLEAIFEFDVARTNILLNKVGALINDH